MMAGNKEKAYPAKKKLTDALVELMQKKAVGEMTVSELCRLASVNRSTFYRYYGCPRDILTEKENDLLDGMQRSLKTEKSISLSSQVEQICRYLKKNQKDAVLVFQHNSADSHFAQNLFRLRRHEQVHDSFFRKEYDEKEQELLLAFLAGGIYHMIRHWLMHDVPETPEEMGQFAEKAAGRGWLEKEKI